MFVISSDPPARPIIEGPIKVIKYTSFYLTCRVDSNPAASYWWTHTQDPSAKLIARGTKIKILSTETNRASQIRLLPEEQSDLGLHYFLFRLGFLDALPYGNQSAEGTGGLGIIRGYNKLGESE